MKSTGVTVPGGTVFPLNAARDRDMSKPGTRVLAQASFPPPLSFLFPYYLTWEPVLSDLLAAPLSFHACQPYIPILGDLQAVK